MNQLAEGLRLKETGVAQVTAANADWMHCAMIVLDKVREVMDLKAVNADILRTIVVRWIGEPASPNAWGALFTHLEKSGKLIYTGTHTRSTRKAARGRQIPVWRWA